MKIAVAAGTRPEFIQMEPVIRELKRRNIETVFIHSGQHYDYEMDRIFFDEMHMPDPTHYLGVGSKLPGEQIGEMIVKSENILRSEKPDMLLVTGDTNTALGVALAANKAKIRIGHFEAGMRSFDRTMPEEINRILIDNLSDVLFSPTQRGVDNLHNSGIQDNIFLVGDVMLDSIVHYQTLIKSRPRILSDISLGKESYLLLTLHREANTDNHERLRSILGAVGDLSDPVVFPIHPRTKQRISDFSLSLPENIYTVPPQGYFEFLRLIFHSAKLLTDSGGAQKQAFFLSKPCITLRPNTEWVETVDDGWNILVDDTHDRIVEAVNTFNPKTPPNLSLFGNGRSAERIIEKIQTLL
ncbi:non-hydrolyzing UDP-N-acetylglucosamine 2-epimerase [Methanoregula sp.]|uniref:non-hydrolyzing UDP-N-acetylglucosamine 2-epimerase n=1 Tax=Methanoregula sp. TaxID=2052170 RepID=UPI002CB90818|nr:UDP-N-acetylglucosamine 2-epimerase (non-hydrolyzing) [Methanoregula sp.]HVP95684.1 UDP-N-acetylglucosamine 2-epimerase (non-hydrolyzing) [Methanoregula sp.]